VGAISQGETPSATAVTEAALTLNEVFQEWQVDGLQLWKVRTVALTGTISTGITITIGSGKNVTSVAPLKVLDMYYRNTTSGADTPLLPITKDEYDRLSPKATTGVPNQVFYQTPEAVDSAVNSGNAYGTFHFFPALSTTFIADNTIYYTGQHPYQDFDASTDQPDIPRYLTNALVWALADQLAYEYGVGLSERDRITKKAQVHKAIAMSFDQEEGSLFLSPEPRWEE